MVVSRYTNRLEWSMSYLRIARWDEYQHYKDRRPPWVKFYTALLDNYELNSLPYGEQLLACKLLLVAARCENRIKNDSKWLANATHIDAKTVASGLRDLRRIGFVEPDRRKRRASTQLAERLSKTETEAEKKQSNPRAVDVGEKGDSPGVSHSEQVRNVVAAQFGEAA
jgi:hypothetical protein